MTDVGGFRVVGDATSIGLILCDPTNLTTTKKQRDSANPSIIRNHGIIYISHTGPSIGGPTRWICAKNKWTNVNMIDSLAEPSPFGCDPRTSESVVDVHAIDVDGGALTERAECVLEDDGEGLVGGGLDVGCYGVGGVIDEGCVFSEWDGCCGVVDCRSEAFVEGHGVRRW